MPRKKNAGHLSSIFLGSCCVPLAPAMAVVAPALLENPRDGWKSVRALTRNFVNFLGDIFGQRHNVLGLQITLICAVLKKGIANSICVALGAPLDSGHGKVSWGFDQVVPWF